MYFNFDESMIKQNGEDVLKSKSVNPRFSGHTHSDASKLKIAISQSKRYNAIKDYLRQGMNTLSEDDVKRICREMIPECLKEFKIEILDDKGLHTLSEEDVTRICNQVINDYFNKHATPVICKK